MSDLLPIIAMIWLVMGALGAFVALQKGRSPIEGLMMGFLFGPFGVLITALLPTMPTGDKHGQSDSASIGQGKARSLEDRRQIAYLEDRYRDILEEVAPDWRNAPYHRRKTLLRNYDKKLMKELKLTPTRFDELSIAAMRPILNQR
jgi:hypothetical protein